MLTEDTIIANVSHDPATGEVCVIPRSRVLRDNESRLRQ